MAWQYNGAAPMVEILEWCMRSLDPHTYSYMGWETIYFSDEPSYIMFRLRWV